MANQKAPIVVMVIDPARGPSVERIQPGLEALQMAVGGTERVTVDRVLLSREAKGGLDVWVDDDGLSKELPFNVWAVPLLNGVAIAGRMVVIRFTSDGEVASLTTADLAMLERRLPKKPEASFTFVEE